MQYWSAASSPWRANSINSSIYSLEPKSRLRCSQLPPPWKTLTTHRFRRCLPLLLVRLLDAAATAATDPSCGGASILLDLSPSFASSQAGASSMRPQNMTCPCRRGRRCHHIFVAVDTSRCLWWDLHQQRRHRLQLYTRWLHLTIIATQVDNKTKIDDGNDDEWTRLFTLAWWHFSEASTMLAPRFKCW